MEVSLMQLGKRYILQEDAVVGIIAVIAAVKMIVPMSPNEDRWLPLSVDLLRLGI